jgi:hypothetical protein
MFGFVKEVGHSVWQHLSEVQQASWSKIIYKTVVLVSCLCSPVTLYYVSKMHQSTFTDVVASQSRIWTSISILQDRMTVYQNKNSVAIAVENAEFDALKVQIRSLNKDIISLGNKIDNAISLATNASNPQTAQRRK